MRSFVFVCVRCACAVHNFRFVDDNFDVDEDRWCTHFLISLILIFSFEFSRPCAHESSREGRRWRLHTRRPLIFAVAFCQRLRKWYETNKKSTTNDDEVTPQNVSFFLLPSQNVVHFTCQTGRTYPLSLTVGAHWNYYDYYYFRCNRRGKILTPFSALSCQFAYWKYIIFGVRRSTELVVTIVFVVAVVFVGAIRQFVGKLDLFCASLFIFIFCIIFFLWITSPSPSDGSRMEWKQQAEESFKRHTYKFVY